MIDILIPIVVLFLSLYIFWFHTVHNSTSLNTQRPAPKTNNSNYDSNVAYSTGSPSLTTASSYENGSSVMRKSPEGKDNDSFRLEDNSKPAKESQQKYHEPNNKLIDQHQRIGNDISTEIFSASNDNGKINVQVTVQLVGEFSYHFSFVSFRSFYFKYFVYFRIWFSMFRFIDSLIFFHYSDFFGRFGFHFHCTSHECKQIQRCSNYFSFVDHVQIWLNQNLPITKSYSFRISFWLWFNVCCTFCPYY